uniref:Putative f-box only protein 42 n=1 Tax=Lutzomyia longipalpis TaxID=7200 RepID=A0A1B0CLQ5_LUTLO
MATINDLPDEVLEFIINLLPPYKDVESCRLVCKRWADLGKNARFRKTINFQRSVAEGNLCWKEWEPPDAVAPRIAGRFSHCAAVFKSIMYIFGGGSSKVTTFNDLWAFNLSTRTWIRCNSHGNHPYPSPKARATMVCHEGQLVVFGGLRYPPIYPPFQRVCLFDELHVYNLEEEHWFYPKISTPWPPAMAGHSATIHGRQMVIFGGLQETALNVTYSNDIWCLDLETYVWKLQKTSPTKPEPRIDHYQIRLDDEHLLIVGGVGGVNNPFTDMWLLTMISSVWTWKEIPVRNKKCGATRMWTNPSCHVDEKLIVLGQNSTLPKDLQITNQIRLNIQAQRTFPQHQEQHRLRNPFQDPPNLTAPPPPLYGGGRRQPARGDAAAPEPSRVRQNFPRASSDHHHLGMMAFRESHSGLDMRERRLAALQKREQELQARRGMPLVVPTPKPTPCPPKKTRQNCEALFICDLSHVLHPHEPFVEWQEVQDGGVLPGAPVKTILSSLVAGNGELIVFGGLEQNTNQGNYTANNYLHFITVPHTVI